MISKLASKFVSKKPKIIIDCYTANEQAYKHYKIESSKKFLPKFMDKIKARGQYGTLDVENLMIQGDLRGCSGFTSLFAKSLTLPLWSDLLIDVGPFGGGYKYRFADGKSVAQNHPQVQRGEYLPEHDYATIKLVSPWVIRCNRDIDFVWSQAMWNFDQPAEILIPPAIVNYKSMTHGTNINIAIPRTGESKIIKISANQALVNITPMTEEPYEVRLHLVSQQELNKQGEVETGTVQTTFLNGNKGAKVRKCPFSGRVA